MDQADPDSFFAATSEVEGDHVRVLVSGEVDMATADAMIRSTNQDGVRRITLDLRSVSFFDSAAIHAVVRLAEEFPDALTVLPSRQVRRVLDISGLGDQPWLHPG
ncbi:STAS domain-containing protein [Plantactinospora sp. KBS50]|uniref:STAS domain-containing protein n=1 Tax=Plantactinospora sp. KBS50 TaxID=2024580 RepID=UPI0018DEF91C|nr:STAS domain-containing protein [Plantactinospora sp. KBS50]